MIASGGMAGACGLVPRPHRAAVRLEGQKPGASSLPGKEVGAMGAQMNERTGLVGGLVLLLLITVAAAATAATVLAILQSLLMR